MTEDSAGPGITEELDYQGNIHATRLPTRVNGSWKTPILRRSNNEVVGASFFLTAEDLIELGINLDGESVLQYSLSGDGIEILNQSD